jgi:hypothetical protein
VNKEHKPACDVGEGVLLLCCAALALNFSEAGERKTVGVGFPVCLARVATAKLLPRELCANAALELDDDDCGDVVYCSFCGLALTEAAPLNTPSLHINQAVFAATHKAAPATAAFGRKRIIRLERFVIVQLLFDAVFCTACQTCRLVRRAGATAANATNPLKKRRCQGWNCAETK